MNCTVGAIVAGIAYTLLILRWHGHTGEWESLEIIPRGQGPGVVMASSFVALTSNLKHEDMAVAMSGLYLAGNVGTVLGVSASTSIQKGILKSLLMQTPGVVRVRPSRSIK